MYKILIKIIVLAVGLVVFSARAGAASITIAPASHALRSTETTLVYTSASSPGITILHNFSSPIRIAINFMQSPDIPPVASSSSDNNPVAIPSLGKLDGIAWDKLEQPDYESLINRLLAIPAAIGPWEPNTTSKKDTSLIHNPSILNSQTPQSAGAGYALFLNKKTLGELMRSCLGCQLPSSTAAIAHPTGTGDHAAQAQGAYLPMINCASCHMLNHAQISSQLRGVQ